MDGILDGNFVDEYFADEERLENARIQMIQNIDQYDKMMPGFKEQALEIASSPEKWREAMLQARDQIQKLKEQRDAQRRNTQTSRENRLVLICDLQNYLHSSLFYSIIPHSVDDVAEDDDE